LSERKTTLDEQMTHALLMEKSSEQGSDEQKRAAQLKYAPLKLNPSLRPHFA
jgi:hypothetical protein